MEKGKRKMEKGATNDHPASQSGRARERTSGNSLKLAASLQIGYTGHHQPPHQVTKICHLVRNWETLEELWER